VRTTSPFRHGLLVVALAATGFSGCKAVTERYIACEVWKYEKLFGHLPPGFVPPGAAAPMAAASPPVCGSTGGGVPCQNAGCGPGTEGVVGGGMASGNCNGCNGAVVDGGIPAGAIPMGSPGAPSLPAGPGGSPGPVPTIATPTGLSRSRPVVISDEVVLP
jgi:hypothetical protein